ncbi:MAG TPA: MoxR family ATPase [Caldithrix abyssi]|uniref:MoxR family ATPase n=1 Tax=Caldithrix abyssi TaxID=187145 RepID=A0A7V4U044_CALAY|nr:MoxR family ATPase [Caldithrix abyssi]
MSPHEAIQELHNRMSQSIIGQEHIVERLIIGLLANGNLLVEGLPGLAKTRAVKSMAKHLHADFSRIQFTPDLLPSDITGTEIYYSSGGKGEFRFEPGPLFANIVLADEINRAPAKVQAALLEAMEERQVTVAKKTHKMPDLFMVMATQNPIEQEGTYPLPEAQMDRFIMHVVITYPDEASERQVLQLLRKEEKGKDSRIRGNEEKNKEEPLQQDVIFAARKEIMDIHIAENMEKYIVALVNATRFPEKYSDDLKKWIEVGASPRGAIGLDKCSRVHAWLNGSDFVTPDNIRAVVHDVLRHRIMLSYQANASGINADQVIDEVLKLVAVA